MRKLQDAGNPIAGKDLLHARKMPEKVCEIGCNFGPRFGTQFWLQFWRPFFQIILIGPKTGAKTGPKTGSQTWAQNCNQFHKLFQAFFGHAANLCPLWGCPRLATFALRVLACVLRRLTTSSYLGGSLNGSHILRAFQVLKFGPPFSCNMLRATRRHAIDGEETQGPRAGEAKMKTGQNPSVKEQKHAKPNSPRLHNIKFAHICLDMKNIGFRSEISELFPCGQRWLAQELGQTCLCQRHSNKPRDTWSQCHNSVDLVCGRNEFQFTRHLCDTELASTLIMGRGDLR